MSELLVLGKSRGSDGRKKDRVQIRTVAATDLLVRSFLLEVTTCARSIELSRAACGDAI